MHNTQLLSGEGWYLINWFNVQNSINMPSCFSGKKIWMSCQNLIEIEWLFSYSDCILSTVYFVV